MTFSTRKCRGTHLLRESPASPMIATSYTAGAEGTSGTEISVGEGTVRSALLEAPERPFAFRTPNYNLDACSARPGFQRLVFYSRQQECESQPNSSLKIMSSSDEKRAKVNARPALANACEPISRRRESSDKRRCRRPASCATSPYGTR